MSAFRTVQLHGRVANGRVALVDEPDCALVSLHRWTVLEVAREGRANTGPYALTRIPQPGGDRTVYMHQMISGCQKTDHANHNGLDNRRENLRPATAPQNAANQFVRSDSVSGFKGVSWHTQNRVWYARIKVNGKARYLGCYPIPEEAALAYDAAAREHFGEFAALNFPAPGERAA